MKIQIKRAYEEAANRDGYRVLVDRLWPRGIKKEDLAYAEWAKDLAPSNELRQALHEGDIGQSTFRERYLKELKDSDVQDHLKELGQHAQKKQVTLVIAGKDVENSHAHVLIEALEKAV